jgi:hypothetical protein
MKTTIHTARSLPLPYWRDVFHPGPLVVSDGATPLGLTALLVSATFFLAPPSAAQIFEKKLLAPNGAGGDQFGERVALIPGWAFCAAPLDDAVEDQSGAVYVYQETGTDWPFLQKLKANAPTFGGAFGSAISASGAWLVSTTPYDDPQGYFGRGSAHVYNLQGGTWNYTQTILTSDFTLGSQEYFGTSASLRGDRMVIGEDDDSAQNYKSGSAYVFELQGSTWLEVAKLYPSDPEPGGAFGCAVAVDGDTLVVGDLSHDNGPVLLNRGAAYVFERIGGTWVQTQKLVASDPKQGDYFGNSVAISGSTILVGSGHSHTITNDGAMYVFERQGGIWAQTQELLAADPQGGPEMGLDVALEGDIAIGSAHDDEDLGQSSGSAYVFHRNSSGTWLQVAKVLPPDGQPSQLFSSKAVALSGSEALIGSWGDQDNGINSGSAYVFELAPDAVQYGSCPTQGPCGNHDDFGGCRTSSGQGGVLSAAGSSSVTTDDLHLEARWLPPNKLGLFFMGGWATALPFADGQLCVASGGAGIWRFNPPQSSGAAGVLKLGPGVAGLSSLLPRGGHIALGQVWHFQAWFRDPAGPCGKGSNMTNALRVVFGP